MKLLLSISAIVAFLIGFALIFVTRPFLASSGIQVTDTVALMAKVQGVLLFSFGVINWLSRNVIGWAGLHAVLTGNFLVHVGSIPVNIYALRSHLVSPQIWGEVVLHLAFGFAFAYFLLRGLLRGTL